MVQHAPFDQGRMGMDEKVTGRINLENLLNSSIHSQTLPRYFGLNPILPPHSILDPIQPARQGVRLFDITVPT